MAYHKKAQKEPLVIWVSSLMFRVESRIESLPSERTRKLNRYGMVWAECSKDDNHLLPPVSLTTLDRSALRGTRNFRWHSVSPLVVKRLPKIIPKQSRIWCRCTQSNSAPPQCWSNFRKRYTSANFKLSSGKVWLFI